MEYFDATARAARLLLLALVCAGIGSTNATFDSSFRRFLHDNGYVGGLVGAMKAGRLYLSRGYGVTRDGTEVKLESPYPVSRISQSITAVAILHLQQTGLLDLDDTVFGPQGILHMITPLPDAAADPRLHDITIRHLLQHSAGFDPTQAPMLDPVLNEVYQSRGESVPSIAEETQTSTPLDANTIVRFAISKPLDYTPGTKTISSNLGYLILGRVVEEASGLMYEDYVKRHILNPCGMWRTHMGAPRSTFYQHKLDTDLPVKDMPPMEKQGKDAELSLFDVIDPKTVDSALGWYSTVYDMLRFSRCVLESSNVLNDQSMEVLLARPDTTETWQQDSWIGGGLHSNARNIVWQDGDPHADDAILYHNLNPTQQQEDEQTPDTWIVLLHGSKLHHLRHKTEELMHQLKNLADDNNAGNEFVDDLNDVDASAAADDVLIKFGVDEHHLDAYVSAVKMEGYDVKWVSPYTHRYHTSFLIISRRWTSNTQPELDYKVVHGLSEIQLLSHKLHMEAQNYNLTFLQSYQSQSHQTSNCFLAIFRRHAYSTETQLKYGTDHLPEPYDKLVQMYHEKYFKPLVQSVLPNDEDEEEHMSFLFVQTPEAKQVDFKTYLRLSDSKLERTILHNAKLGRTLTFLDAYQLEGKPKFAAVFTNESAPRWHFQAGLHKHQAVTLIESMLSTGLRPTAAVGYTDTGSEEPKYAVYLTGEQTETTSTSPLAADLSDYVNMTWDSREEDQGQKSN